MNMTEVKTAELVGAALDWAVAQVDGVKTLMMSPRKDEPKKPFALFGSLALSVGGDDQSSYAPSTCWHCGGPLIDVHQIEFSVNDDTDIVRASMFCWRSYGKSHRTRWSSGETHLIAAMRAIVAAKLGDVMSVPSELLEPWK